MSPQLVLNVAGVQSTENSCLMEIFSCTWVKAEGRRLFRADRYASYRESGCVLNY